MGHDRLPRREPEERVLVVHRMQVPPERQRALGRLAEQGVARVEAVGDGDLVRAVHVEARRGRERLADVEVDGDGALHHVHHLEHLDVEHRRVEHDARRLARAERVAVQAGHDRRAAAADLQERVRDFGEGQFRGGERGVVGTDRLVAHADRAMVWVVDEPGEEKRGRRVRDVVRGLVPIPPHWRTLFSDDGVRVKREEDMRPGCREETYQL